MELKKIFSVLATGALTASLLAACSGESANKSAPTQPAKKPAEAVKLEPEAGATLKLWDNGGKEGAWAKAVAAEFTKKYSVPVKVEESAHDKAAEKVDAAGPTGKGPDVFHAPHDHVGNMENSGAIFENKLGKAYTDRFVDAAITGTTGKEKQYGFPLAVETYALYYNKKLVKEPAETWEELFKQAKEFQKGSTDKDRKYGLMLEPGNYYIAHSIVGGYGGYVFGGKNGTDVKDLGLDSKGAIQAGEFVKKIHDELLPLKNEDIKGDLISSMFNEGKLMYRISGPWDIKNHQDAKVDFGVTTLPKLENGKVPTSFSGIKAYYVSAYTKYPKAATLLAEFATSDEMLIKRYEMTGQMPASKKALETDAIKNDAVLNGFAKQLKYAQPMPNIAEMQSVWEPAGKAFTAIWNGQASPKEALTNATKDIKGKIENQQK
ncbi:sugar ABC transporter substrate-binding protein [Peribacillus deserti]|uniref:Maltodextrin-binding protein n=1 Tax=Peribacillus deserti TaxID=673318 RepID=A0A2N5M522_9BACI|nr:maltose ABC transporter substrate-binding protein [Peribacillus deserti]PLT29466.1 maltose ABC transporter substrate-binding protein [Peribacillus deserti]